MAAALDGGELPGEVGHGVVGRLARADVVEGPGAHDVEPLCLGVLMAHKIRGGFTRRVRAGRTQERTFIVGLVRRLGVAVDQPAAHVEDPGPAAPAEDGIVERSRHRQVAGPGRVGFLERSAGVGIARQVVNVLRLHFTKDVFDAGAVPHVAGPERHAPRQMLPFDRPLRSPADAEQLDVPPRQQRLGQVAARETGCASDKDTHKPSLVSGQWSVVSGACS